MLHWLYLEAGVAHVLCEDKPQTSLTFYRVPLCGLPILLKSKRISIREGM